MGYVLRDSVIKSRAGLIKFRKSASGSIHYHIGVWLATSNEEERDAVSRVDYLLHPTFRPPERYSENRANDFSITFWAWGAFEVQATAHFVDPQKEPLLIRHQLRPQLPADTGKNYEQVD